MMTNKKQAALEALEEIVESEKNNIEDAYGHALDYPVMRRKYNRDMEWIEERYKTIREALTEDIPEKG